MFRARGIGVTVQVMILLPLPCHLRFISRECTALCADEHQSIGRSLERTCRQGGCRMEAAGILIRDRTFLQSDRLRAVSPLEPRRAQVR